MRALILLLAIAGTAAAEPAKYTDDRCTKPPEVARGKFEHKRNRALAKVGSPNHRGIDVIAREEDGEQRIAGKAAYTKADKDLEDEVVNVLACFGGIWLPAGTTRTDSDGRFEIVLKDKHRLPVGMRDMYLAVPGDGTGAWFVAYVAPKDTKVVITDIDGTISWSENSIIKQAIAKVDIKHRPDAPESLAKSPYPIVYVTARGDLFTEITRQWLARHGFPRGLLRLSRGLFEKPGDSSVEYKSDVFSKITVPVAAGIGNRKSDITAYTKAGIPPKYILIHLPEFESEVGADLTAKKAVGFASYRDLPSLLP